jgi:thiamine biosynthesis lipoprotein
MNAAAGQTMTVSPQLVRLVSASLALAERSGGLFDPTVLRSLEAAGYDRSFESVGAGEPRQPGCAGSDPGSWRDVQLDLKARTITLAPGMGIELGGIGKGWAVDRMAAIIGAPGLVNAGGDLFAAGRPHDAEAWMVGVEDPFHPERDLAVLAVRDRGVATSTTLRRRWFNGEAWAHHLIDPRTGAPSTSDACQVTVVAGSAMLADYHAKVALLLGVDEGLRYLESQDAVEGLMVAPDGVLTTGGLQDFVVHSRRKV